MLQVKRELVPGNFAIYFFLGDSSEDPVQWGSDPSSVGSYTTFKSTVKECENCRDQAETLIYGSIHLTDMLHDLLPQGTTLLDKDAVVAFLREKLDWRIRRVSEVDNP